MRIRLIVAQYKQRYEGQYMPNVMDAWDEYVLDENGEGYQEKLQKYQAMVPNELEWVRELDVTVPDDVITSLADVPELPTLWRQVI